MPRTSSAPTKPPRRDPDQVRKRELAQTKLKLRNLREENSELKRSGKIKDLRIAGLQKANDYLAKCAEANGKE